MTKKIEYLLEYREDGERKVYQLEIDFVSNYCIREFNHIMQVVYDVQNKWDKIGDLRTEIAALRTDRPDGYVEKSALLENEINSLANQITANDTEGILKKRFELVKQILSDNGYKEPFFYQYDFWDKCVDPAQIIEFISLCAWKDIPKKKH